MQIILLEIFAYLCGSIPFGLIVSKFAKGVDIREHGSHNIGATNAARVMGKKYGALVLLLDGLKALVPLMVARHFFGNDYRILALTAVVTILGHIFPVWLKFKGGKGISCLLFSLFYLDYVLGIVFLGTWITIFLLSRTSALAALTALVATTVVSFFISPLPYSVMMLALSILIFYRHKDNIKRLMSGEELKFKNNKR